MQPETCFIVDIGQHKRQNFAPVAKLLSSRDITGMCIFTEANDSEVKRKHPFYGKLSKFIYEHNAVEIHETGYTDSMQEALQRYEDTLPPLLKTLRSSSFGWQPQTRVEEFDRLTQIICYVRDPLIAKDILAFTPKYSIFGAGHIPGVLEILKNQPRVNVKVLSIF